MSPSPVRTTASVASKEWVREAQNRIVGFLLAAYGTLLAATMVIFFLQGFRLWGFFLEPSILKWLGGATIGEVVGLLTITIRYYFKG
jgi:hypothetical protein